MVARLQSDYRGQGSKSGILFQVRKGVYFGVGASGTPVIPHRQYPAGGRKNSAAHLGISSSSRALEGSFTGGRETVSERSFSGH